MASSVLPVAVTAASLMVIFGVGRWWAGRLDNFGILDIFWTYGFIVAGVGSALLSGGWGPRRILIASLVTLWSLRLGTHVLRRVARAHPREDPRYGQWRKAWGSAFPARMTAFFQLQAFSVVVLSWPFYVAGANAAAGFSRWELAGSAIVLLGIGGETVSDLQLDAYKRHPGPGTSVCQRGLWRYSRHPNYFFEFVTWLGFFGYGLGSPGGFWGAISPALILYFLLGVTGIPMTERQSLASKGDAFRKYQRSTSPFVPWFRKPVTAP